MIINRPVLDTRCTIHINHTGIGINVLRKSRTTVSPRKIICCYTSREIIFGPYGRRHIRSQWNFKNVYAITAIELKSTVLVAFTVIGVIVGAKYGCNGISEFASVFFQVAVKFVPAYKP